MKYIKTLCLGMGLVIGGGTVYLIEQKEIRKKGTEVFNKQKFYVDKNFTLFSLAADWIRIRQNGKSLTNFFKDNEFKTVGIYGMGILGERLVEELSKGGIEITFVMDRNQPKNAEGLNYIKAGLEVPEVDAIIVTAVSYFYEIEEELLKVTDVPIISLDDVISDVKEDIN